MESPDPERQVQFLVDVRRLLSDGSFVATYKFALLLSLAELAVEGVDESTESLSVGTRDLAEKFIGFYWRQVLPWVHAPSGVTGRLHQATGSSAAILNLVGAAHERYSGSLFRCRADKEKWKRLVGEVARVIAVMPLWKLQTIGRQRLDFLYPNTGKGNVIHLRPEAVYCLNRFRDLIGDMTETAWVRFVRRLPRNRGLIGEGPDLREFLFGSDRTALARARGLLLELDGNRCFYCDSAIRGEPVVDHFVPWARYPLDLGHNYVLADARCNGGKADRLAAFDHLSRWCERNARPDRVEAFERRLVPHDAAVTRRVASWAYGQAAQAKATVWKRGRDGMVGLDPRWRSVLIG
jgi:hypothetical protein